VFDDRFDRPVLRHKENEGPLVKTRARAHTHTHTHTHIHEYGSTATCRQLFSHSTNSRAALPYDPILLTT